MSGVGRDGSGRETAARPSGTSGLQAAAWRVPQAIASDVEMQVLLCVARRNLDADERRVLGALLSGTVDWARLCRLAARHRLLPLLHWHLRDLGTPVPREASAMLSRHFMSNACRVLSLTRELVALIKLLEAKGVPCLPYKGPMLAVEAYGNMALRSAGDLDVVVRRRDLPVVRQVLRELGFLPEHRLPAGGEALMERSLYHEAFHRDDCIFEVHWGFTDKSPGFSLDLEALEPRLRTVHVGGEEVPGFSREDLLLVLCVHGAKHMWDDIEGIAALAELLRSPDATDWRMLVALATELGSRRVLFVGLRMAREILGVPLPPDVEGEVFGDAVVAHAAAAARQQLFAASHEERKAVSRATKDAFYLELNERRRDRLRYLLNRLVTPSQAKSWQGVQVGRLYFPLHAVLRPLRAWRDLVYGARGGGPS